jgi:hypothetical protein
MTEERTTTAFEQVLTELAQVRGIDSLEELKDKLRAAGHDETAKSLPENAPGGFGVPLDEVLSLSEEEKQRLANAFAVTFF